jgi:hypothetical protein
LPFFPYYFLIIVFIKIPGRIFRREFHGRPNDYLSPAPHALPHAAGFSAGLSEAPHAAGFSAGLSPAPHAAGLSEPPQDVPQAEAAAPSAFFVHPNKFESAILYNLLNVFSELFPPSVLIILTFYFTIHKYALFCYPLT